VILDLKQILISFFRAEYFIIYRKNNAKVSLTV